MARFTRSLFPTGLRGALSGRLKIDLPQPETTSLSSRSAHSESPTPSDQFIGLFGSLLPEHVRQGLAGIDEGGALSTVGWGALRSGMLKAVRASSPDSWFAVELNGIEVLLPRYTIMTMSHCLHGSFEERLRLWVEYDHWKRMHDLLAGGGVFLDVGAATGAMTVPFAVSLPQVRFLAFEPYECVRRTLEATLERNGVGGRVVVSAEAVSDKPGRATFLEQPEDESGEHNYLPETSSLAPTGGDDPSYQRARSVEIGVTSLDTVLDGPHLNGSGPVVIKVDVEGFETEVVRGAKRLLQAARPTLFIDIHGVPGGEGMTDGAVMAELRPLGYRFERLGHVLVCLPD